MEIKDVSGDKKYFTIIPNYVLNHSSHYDREVYIQMKRITGDTGKCWTSQTNLAKQCGFSVNTLKKSLRYLLDHGWIKCIGKRATKTSGGLQKTNVYQITDIWGKNEEWRLKKKKGVSGEDRPKGVSGDEGVSGGGSKVYQEVATNKNPVNKNPILASKQSLQGTDKIMKIFYKINPTLNFGNKTTRGACSDMIKKFGLAGTVKMAEMIIQVQGKKYAPTATTPYQMKEKLAQFKVYFDREKSNKPSFTKIS